MTERGTLIIIIALSVAQWAVVIWGVYSLFVHDVHEMPPVLHTAQAVWGRG